MVINGYEIIEDGYHYIPSLRGESLQGRTFGRLIVIGGPYKRIEDSESKSYSPCYCTCGKNPGKARFIKNHSLKNGYTKGCGCLRREHMLKLIETYNKGNHCRQGQIKTDLIGKRIGVLKGITPTDKRDAGGHAVWLFKNVLTGEIEQHSRNQVLYGGVNGGSKNPKNGSVGEIRIGEILKENQIYFEKEKTFKDLVSNNNVPLRYDFYLPSFNTLIEFDGEQHFHYCPHFHKNEGDFKNQKDRDIIKNNYAKKRNITLIRIPFTHLKDLCIDDLLPEKSVYKI